MAATPRSLRVELIASLAVVLMMAVASLSFTSEWLGQRRHEQRELARFELHARTMAASASESFARPERVDRERLRQLLQGSTRAQLGVRTAEAYLVDERGAQQVDTAGAGGLELAPPTREPAQKPMAAGPHGMWVIDEPIAVFGRGAADVVPILRLVVQPLPYSDGPYPWHETLIVATGVGVVLLVLGGLLLESKVLGPLRTIEAATARVGEGELDVRVPEDGPQEFAALARSFNAMTTALREQTERIDRQYRALQSAEKMATVGRLAAGVAHEVGNPLAAVGGYLEFVLDPRADEPLGEHTRDVLTRVQTQTVRMQRIIRQLLDYSQPYSGEMIDVDLFRQASDLVTLVAADPRAKGVQLDVVGEPGTMGRADPGFLQQVLLNLVVNGAVAAREGGESTPCVQIRVGRDASVAWLEVQDNGAGVPDEIRGELFEPFVSMRPAGEGTGLGLANSHGLVERMNGKLCCLHDGAREHLADSGRMGAVFRLELPADAATTAVES